MKKYFLTTALLGAFIAPAYAEDAADELITGGAGTCTVDVLGVSDNNATANTIAVWSINEYTLAPGEYLNVTETSVDKTTCPAGSYCVGGTGFTVDNAKTSIATCPAEYPNSAAGAGAQNQCYTACTVATANIAHATAVGGNDYFGDGADACYATECDTGYHVDGDIELVENDPLIPVDYTLAGNDYEYIAQGGTADDADTAVGLSAQNTWASVFDYGVVYGKASCQASSDPGIVYFYNNVNAVMGGTMTTAELRTGLVPLVGESKADVIVEYVDVTLASMSGDSSVSEESVENSVKKFFAVFGIEPDANYQTTNTGQYCYCQMDGFAPATDGVLGEKTSVSSAPWLFIADYRSADVCTSNCARNCAFVLQYDGVDSLAFRAAVFGALGYTETATCAANTINIDWNPDNGGEHTKNMCTYEGSITLPTPDPVKPGYTFTGWKLVESTTTTE